MTAWSISNLALRSVARFFFWGSTTNLMSKKSKVFMANYIFEDVISLVGDHGKSVSVFLSENYRTCNMKTSDLSCLKI